MIIVRLDILTKFVQKKQKNTHIFNLLLINEVNEKPKHDTESEFHEPEPVILPKNDGIMI